MRTEVWSFETIPECATLKPASGFVDRKSIVAHTLQMRKTRKTAKAKPFDAAKYVDSPEMIAAYLNEALEFKTHLPSLLPSARLPALAA